MSGRSAGGAIQTTNDARHRQLRRNRRQMVERRNLHLHKTGITTGAHDLEHRPQLPLIMEREIHIEFAVKARQRTAQPVPLADIRLPVPAVFLRPHEHLPPYRHHPIAGETKVNHHGAPARPFKRSTAAPTF